MIEATLNLDSEAARYLRSLFSGPIPDNPGLSICLATQDHESIYNAHSIDLCGFADDQILECEPIIVLGQKLWIRPAEKKLLLGRKLTVIEAGEPKKRWRLVIEGISELEVRQKLLMGV